MKPHFLLTTAMLVAYIAAYSQIRNISSLGGELPRATAEQWIRNNSSGCHAAPVFYLGKDVMRKMLADERAAGVYIFNALDENGREQLIFWTADGDGNINSEGLGYVAQSSPDCPVTTCGGVIQYIAAQPMIERFQSAFNDRFMAHAYGIRLFDQLLDQKGAEGISIATGLDENNQEHLIIGSIDKHGETMWNAMLFNHGSEIFSFLFTWASFENNTLFLIK